jgi:outer membrane protein
MKSKFNPIYQNTFLGFSTFFLVQFFAGSSLAEMLDPQLAKTLNTAYPDAKILEQRSDTLQGIPVTEVELRTVDGKELEVTLSAQGKILEVEEESSLPIIGGELTIGIGGQWENAQYKGTDDEIEVVPFMRYENGMFELRAYDGITASLTPFESNGFYLSALGTYNMGEGYDPDDSTFLKGMDTLDDTFSAGLTMGKKMGKWEVSLQGLQDVSGKHDGQEISLELSRHIDMGSFSMRPAINATWMSSDMVDYYYGVETHEVRSDRPLYSPDASFEFGAQVLFEQELTDHFSIIGYVDLTLPGSEITDSPLVNEDYELTGVIGLGYTF